MSAWSAAAASNCRTFGSTKSDTRMPASRSIATMGASAARCPAASRPPSVVTSARRSGTMQQAFGRKPQRDGHHLRRGGHFHVERHPAISARSRSRSASRMCRRSSRRCAVIPSAPAATAAKAASTGSGCTPPRALRTVATWSMFTPRRIMQPSVPPIRQPCARRRSSSPGPPARCRRCRTPCHDRARCG